MRQQLSRPSRSSLRHANAHMRRLRITATVQHRLYVDDRCAIDRFNRANEELGAADLAYVYPVESERVWPIRRAREEDAGEGVLRLPTRMHFEHVPIGQMQPRDHDDVIAHGEAGQG